MQKRKIAFVHSASDRPSLNEAPPKGEPPSLNEGEKTPTPLDPIH